MSKTKILFLAANPENTTQLKLDEEIRAIVEKIRGSEYREKLEIISAWAVRPDDLLQYLNEHRPQIVHFSGHGSQNGEIVLLDNQRMPKPVGPTALKALFTALKDNIQVVVLNACFSELQALAIAEIIDYVIGMNTEIGDDAAIVFAASFYRAIGFDRSIQEAFEQARIALMLEGIPEEHTPVLIIKEGANNATRITEQHFHPIVQNAFDNLNSANATVREASIQTLKTTQHPSALEALISATHHPTTDVRLASLNALKTFHSLEIYNAFCTACKDSNQGIRVVAIDGLRFYTESSSLPILLDALEDPTIEVVITALETLLFHREDLTKSPEIIRKLLMFWGQNYKYFNLLNQRVKGVMGQTESVISQISNGIPIILEVVEETKEAAIDIKLLVHLLACGALVKTQSEAATEAYLYFIEEANYGRYIEYSNLRDKAALALAGLGDQRAGSALIEARRDYWTASGPTPYILVPDDEVYDDPFTKALRALGYPFHEDPHYRDYSSS